MKDASPSSKRPRSGRAFWAKKMAGNIARDRFVNRELRKVGWKVVRIWEHELRNGVQVIARISKALG